MLSHGTLTTVTLPGTEPHAAVVPDVEPDDEPVVVPDVDPDDEPVVVPDVDPDDEPVVVPDVDPDVEPVVCTVMLPCASILRLCSV